MDLHAAVMVSMLGVSRSRASAVFKELRQARSCGSGRGRPGCARACAARIECASKTARADPRTRAIAAARRGRNRAVAWFDSAYPALLNCIPDPPPVLWTRGDLAVLSLPAVAIVGSRAATPYALDVAVEAGAASSPVAALRSSAASRAASTPPHIAGRSRRTGRRSQCWARVWIAFIPPSTEVLPKPSAGRALVMSELAPGGLPLAGALPAPQPDHQWHITRGRRGRGIGEERIADYRSLRDGAGSGRDGGPGERAVGPQSRLPQPVEGRGKGCRDVRTISSKSSAGPRHGPRVAHHSRPRARTRSSRTWSPGRPTNSMHS